MSNQHELIFQRSFNLLTINDTPIRDVNIDNKPSKEDVEVMHTIHSYAEREIWRGIEKTLKSLMIDRVELEKRDRF